MDAEILLEGPGRFVIIIKEREVHLSTEKGNVDEAMLWVLALQHASLGADGARGACRKSVLLPPGTHGGRPVRPALPAQALGGIAEEAGDVAEDDLEAEAYWRERKMTADQEVDGNKIDDARWAALRKGWLREQGYDPDADTATTAELDDEDEDVRIMREMEEEEERRQEEERRAFLAERERQKREAATAESAAASAADADETEGGADLSEDEGDWFADMQAQEAAEAARQEAERQEWLAQNAKAGTTP